jgi:hypothetical protein
VKLLTCLGRSQSAMKAEETSVKSAIQEKSFFSDTGLKNSKFNFEKFLHRKFVRIKEQGGSKFKIIFVSVCNSCISQSK